MATLQKVKDAGLVGSTTSRGGTTMAGLEIRQLDSAPDEVRPFVAKGRAQLVNLANGPVGMSVFEPGWRWSEHVKPIAGTESCRATHLGYIVSGRLHVRMDDGSEGDVGPGDAVRIDPGHDAWVVGDEPCVMVDFGAVGNPARA